MYERLGAAFDRMRWLQIVRSTTTLSRQPQGREYSWVAGRGAGPFARETAGRRPSPAVEASGLAAGSGLEDSPASRQPWTGPGGRCPSQPVAPVRGHEWARVRGRRAGVLLVNLVARRARQDRSVGGCMLSHEDIYTAKGTSRPKGGPCWCYRPVRISRDASFVR